MCTLTRFHSYLYGHSVTVVADPAAVQAILETPNPSGKHARWWTKVYGTGLKDIKITYRAGRLNNADALSWSPCGEMPAEGEVHDEVQVCHVQSQATLESEPADDKSADVTDLLGRPPLQPLNESFADEQREDPEIVEMIKFLQRGKLPTDDQRARQIVLQKPVFTMEEGMLFYLDPAPEAATVSGASFFANGSTLRCKEDIRCLDAPLVVGWHV